MVYVKYVEPFLSKHEKTIDDKMKKVAEKVEETVSEVVGQIEEVIEETPVLAKSTSGPRRHVASAE